MRDSDKEHPNELTSLKQEMQKKSLSDNLKVQAKKSQWIQVRVIL